MMIYEKPIVMEMCTTLLVIRSIQIKTTTFHQYGTRISSMHCNGKNPLLVFKQPSHRVLCWPDPRIPGVAVAWSLLGFLATSKTLRNKKSSTRCISKWLSLILSPHCSELSVHPTVGCHKCLIIGKRKELTPVTDVARTTKRSRRTTLPKAGVTPSHYSCGTYMIFFIGRDLSYICVPSSGNEFPFESG